MKPENKQLFNEVYNTDKNGRLLLVTAWKKERMFNGLTQKEVAQAMLIQQPDVSALENSSNPGVIQTTKYIIAIKKLLKGKTRNEKD